MQNAIKAKLISNNLHLWLCTYSWLQINYSSSNTNVTTSAYSI